MPAESLREGGRYQLVQSREQVTKLLRSALEGDGSWPDWHLLWEQHPLVDWLLDALGASYARHEAPVLRVASLPPAPSSCQFLFPAVVSLVYSQLDGLRLAPRSVGAW